MSAGATMPKAQRYLLFALPIVFIPFIVNFPSGLMIYWLTTNLWTTGQGIVTRRMMPRPDLKARKAPRTPPKEPPPRCRQRSQAKGRATRGRLRHRRGRATAQSAPQALRRRQAEDERGGLRRSDRRDGRRGEVGRDPGARAAAARASSARRSSCRSSRRASAACSASGTHPHACSRPRLAGAAAPEDEPAADSEQAAVVRELLELAVTAIGTPARIRVEETDERSPQRWPGPDTGVLIGRHGQTLDALQYLANAVSHRVAGDARRPVTVDAAGYRARRTATVEAIARRVRGEGLRDRAERRARADDSRGAEGRPRGAEGRPRGRDGERGHGAEPVRGRASRAAARRSDGASARVGTCSTGGWPSSSRHPA